MASDHQSACCLSSISSLGQSSAAPSSYHNEPHVSDDEGSTDEEEEYLFRVFDKTGAEVFISDIASPSSTTTASTVGSLKNLLEMRSPTSLTTSNSTIDDLLLNSSSTRFDSSIPSLTTIKYDSMPSLATISSRDDRRSSDSSSRVPTATFDSSNYIWYDDLDDDLADADDLAVAAASLVKNNGKVKSPRVSIEVKASEPTSYYCLSKAADEEDDACGGLKSPPMDNKKNRRKSMSSVDLVTFQSPTENNTSSRWNMNQFSKHDSIPFSPRRHSHSDIIFSTIQSSPVDIFSFPHAGKEMEEEEDPLKHLPPALKYYISSGSGDTPPKPPRRRGASWESPLPIDSVPIIHHGDDEEVQDGSSTNRE